GKYQHDVFAEGRDLFFHLRFGAVAETHGRNHRADADDHAQHGQGGAKFVSPQRPRRHPQYRKKLHGTSFTASCASRSLRNSSVATNRSATGVSLTIRPSRITTMRFV